MPFLDDLAKATAMFQEGAQGLAIQRAIQNANETTQSIKALEGDEMQKRSQLQQVANALTMDLAAVGAPADRIALIAQSITPPQRFYQTAEQAAINAPSGSPEQMLGKEMIKKELDLKQSQIDATTEQKKALIVDRKNARFSSAIQNYQKRVDSLTKKHNEAFDSATTMLDMLASGNPVSDAAVATFAARATGEVGNLTEEERKPFGGSRAMLRRIQAVASVAATGKMTDADRKDLQSLANTFKRAAQRNIRQRTLSVTQQAARTLGSSQEEIFSLIAPERAGAFDGTVTPPAGAPPPAATLPQIPGLKPLGR